MATGTGKTFTAFQTIWLCNDKDREWKNIYKQFSPDFFNLVIVDECHRGSAAEDSTWREILEYFSGLNMRAKRIISLNLERRRARFLLRFVDWKRKSLWQRLDYLASTKNCCISLFSCFIYFFSNIVGDFININSFQFLSEPFLNFIPIKLFDQYFIIIQFSN